MSAESGVYGKSLAVAMRTTETKPRACHSDSELVTQTPQSKQFNYAAAFVGECLCLVSLHTHAFKLAAVRVDGAAGQWVNTLLMWQNFSSNTIVENIKFS